MSATNPLKRIYSLLSNILKLLNIFYKYIYQIFSVFLKLRKVFYGLIVPYVPKLVSQERGEGLKAFSTIKIFNNYFKKIYNLDKLIKEFYSKHNYLKEFYNKNTVFRESLEKTLHRETSSLKSLYNIAQKTFTVTKIVEKYGRDIRAPEVVKAGGLIPERRELTKIGQKNIVERFIATEKALNVHEKTLILSNSVNNIIKEFFNILTSKRFNEALYKVNNILKSFSTTEKVLNLYSKEFNERIVDTFSREAKILEIIRENTFSSEKLSVEKLTNIEHYNSISRLIVNSIEKLYKSFMGVNERYFRESEKSYLSNVFEKYYSLSNVLTTSSVLREKAIETYKYLVSASKTRETSFSTIATKTILETTRFLNIPQTSLRGEPSSPRIEQKFYNTFNITIQLRPSDEEEDLRELGRKIAKILAEEARKYGVMI